MSPSAQNGFQLTIDSGKNYHPVFISITCTRSIQALEDQYTKNAENDAVEIILEVSQRVCSTKGVGQVLLTSVDDPYIRADRTRINCTVYQKKDGTCMLQYRHG